MTKRATRDPATGSSHAPEEPKRARPLVIGLALFLAAYLLVWFRCQPPAPRPAAAPADEFSAIRAKAALARVLGKQQPHPVGSAADAAVRQALVDALRSLGYQPQVQQAFACNSDGVCAQVQNVLARLEGSAGLPAVLVAAHYDSVPAGPGASDDGSGVAVVLEIARALRTGPVPRHSVIFLLDEGEEAGLLGAVGFADEHPWARQVGAAVNLDARGTSGPSLMFETGSHTRWLMPLLARGVRRPLANSLFYAMYRRLPNDTDFSVFKRHGLDGLNFAFIGGVARYHTPLDDLAHLDPRSLQSQGEHALESVRALANARLSEPRMPGGAVFFDLAAWRMVWWPLGWTPWLAALALLLVVACTWRRVASGALPAPALGRGLVSWLVIVILATLLGAGLRSFLHATGSPPSGWVAHPAALLVAFWALGFLAPVAAALGLSAHAHYWEFWCACWLWWAVAAMLTAVALPEAAFLGVIPALVAGVVGLVAGGFDSPGWRTAAAVVPATVAAALCFEPLLFLYPTLGAPALVLTTPILAMLGTTLAPAVATAPRRLGRTLALTVAATAMVFTVVAALLPPYSPQWPARLTFLYAYSADTGQASWLASSESAKLPLPVAQAAPWTRRILRAFPWQTAEAFRAPANSSGNPPAAAVGPQFDIVEEPSSQNAVHVRGTLWPPAGGGVLALMLPPSVKAVSFRMEGKTLPPLSARALRASNGWRRYACVATPSGGLNFDFTAVGPPKFGAVILEESYVLPPSGSKLLAARPSNAVASQSGDASVWTRTVVIGAAAPPEIRSTLPPGGTGP